MYVLLDEQNIKKGNLIFNKDHPEYLRYVDWCNEGNTPSVDSPDIYEALQGIFKGKTFYVCRKSEGGRLESLSNSRSNRFVLMDKASSKIIEQLKYVIRSILIEKGLSDVQIENRFNSGRGVFEDIRNRDYRSLFANIKNLQGSQGIPASSVRHLKKIVKRAEKRLENIRTDF